ncbi:caspase family protein [Sorangium sp. So ce693]|uniref:caspase family protein n=1 Tax=Sorangium sp. So ce693 TaxID=3133318 RepID=UPI003F5FC45C
MISRHDLYGLQCGTLHVFVDLPERAVRDAFVDEAIREMEEARKKGKKRLLTGRFAREELQRKIERLAAHLATVIDLAARMKAARDGGDAREENRLFRAIVIAKWLGSALIKALLGGLTAGMSRVALVGGKKLELVAQTGHSGLIRLISFSADGSRLITAAGDGRAISWAAATGDELYTFWLDSAKMGEPAGVALSPDGRQMVVVGGEGAAIRYPLLDEMKWLSLHAPFRLRKVRFAAFSSDGARLVTSGAETIVWAVKEGRVEAARRFGERSDPTATVAAFSPRGDLVLTEGPNHDAILWNARTGAQLQALSGHAAPVRAAAFSADGARVATLDTAGVVIVWDAHTAGRLLELAISSAPTSIALSTDGRLLLTVSPGAAVQLWELDAQPPAPRASVAQALAMIGGAIQAADLSPSALLTLLVVGMADGSLYAIDCVSGDVVWSVKAMRLAPTWIEFAADGRRFTVAREDGMAHVWDAGTGGLAEVRPAPAPTPSLELEAILPGQVIRSAQSGEEIGYYERESIRNNPLVRVERLGSVGRWLLTHRDGQVNVLDEKQLPGQWLLTAECQWGAMIAHATTTALSPDGRFVLGGTASGTVELWRVGVAARLCTLLSLADGRWAVADDEGRYDTSQDGEAAGLHWLLDLEPLALSQLKLRYYDPALLAKKMQLRAEPVRAVTQLAPKLFPLVRTTILERGPRRPTVHVELGGQGSGARTILEHEAKGPTLYVELRDQGGGFGTIQIAINGKEALVGRLAQDESGRPFLVAEGRRQEFWVDALRDEATGAIREISFEFSLAGHPYLHQGDASNRVTVVAMDADDVLASRGSESRFAAAGTPGRAPPMLWGIIVGISRYQGPSLRLAYAGKDAADFGKALRFVAEPLFGDRVKVKVLSTDSGDTAEWPTRANIEAAFRWAEGAKSEDVLVVYLSGHGVQVNEGKEDEFYYLTQDAVERAYADPVVWRASALSSQELTKWIKRVPALKQVVLLDTCHAGRFLKDLTEEREVPSSYQRVLERMRDRTGLWLLAGAAADAVSYEASRYAQGLLTYALLSGMRGAALHGGNLIGVGELYNYVVDQVPLLAKGIGGVQRPLLAVPAGGSSFVIGAVDAARPGSFRLAVPLPLVERSSFQDEEEMDDGLALGMDVDEALRDLAEGQPPPFVFVDATGVPDSLRPAGRYRRAADGSIRVTVRLFHDHQRALDRMVEGRADAVDALARRIAAMMAESIRQARGPIA